MVAVAGAKTSPLVASGAERLVALNGGFSSAFIGAAIIAAGAAALSAFAIRMPKAQVAVESQEAPAGKRAA
jgi:hypothetical protein